VNVETGAADKGPDPTRGDEAEGPAGAVEGVVEGPGNAVEGPAGAVEGGVIEGPGNAVEGPGGADAGTPNDGAGDDGAADDGAADDGAADDGAADDGAADDGAGDDGADEDGWSSKSNPKSKSGSSPIGSTSGMSGVLGAAGVPPKRSRNGESMSSDGSMAGPPRGRTGCGAWKTPTAPWPGLATSSCSYALMSSGTSEA
jgi:hypothetical protein